MAFQTTQSVDSFLTRGFNFRLPNNAPISSLYTLYANGAGQTYWSNSINPNDLSTLSVAIASNELTFSTLISSLNSTVQSQGVQISTLAWRVEDVYASSINALNSSLTGISTFSTFYGSLSQLQTATQLGLSTLSTTIGRQNTSTYNTLTSNFNTSLRTAITSTTRFTAQQISTLSSYTTPIETFNTFSTSINNALLSSSRGLTTAISSAGTSLSTQISTVVVNFNNSISTTNGNLNTTNIRVTALENYNLGLPSTINNFISSATVINNQYISSLYAPPIYQLSSAVSSLSASTAWLIPAFSTLSSFTFFNISTLNSTVAWQTAAISTLDRNLSVLTTSSILAGVYDTFMQLEEYTTQLINSTVTTIGPVMSTLFYSTQIQNASISQVYFSTFVSTLYLSAINAVVPSTFVYMSSLVSSLYSTGIGVINSTMLSTANGITDAYFNSSVLGYLSTPVGSTLNWFTTTATNAAVSTAISTAYSLAASTCACSGGGGGGSALSFSTMVSSINGMNTLGVSHIWGPETAARLEYKEGSVGETFQQTATTAIGWGDEPISFSDTGRYGIATQVNDPVGAGTTGFIYTTKDYGQTWTQNATAGSRPWLGNCCSRSGEIMYAADAGNIFGSLVGGKIYISRDYGDTWSVLANTPSKNWRSLACSASGQIIAAVGDSGLPSSRDIFYISYDYGNSWIQKVLSGGVLSFFSVAMSMSGRFIMAVTRTGASAGQIIYLSSDFGATFTAVGPTSTGFRSATMSSDGKHMYTATSLTLVASHDYGATWSSTTPFTGSGAFVTDINTDDSGKFIAAACYDSFFVSSDYGATFTLIESGATVGLACGISANAQVVSYVPNIGFIKTATTSSQFPGPINYINEAKLTARGGAVSLIETSNAGSTIALAGGFLGPLGSAITYDRSSNACFINSPLVFQPVGAGLYVNGTLNVTNIPAASPTLANVLAYNPANGNIGYQAVNAGPTGPTGPAGSGGGGGGGGGAPLAQISYYYGGINNLQPGGSGPVIFNTYDANNSYGTIGGTYDGVSTFTNTTTTTNVYLFTGMVYYNAITEQLVTVQKVGSVLFYGANLVSQGAVFNFAASVVLAPGEQAYIFGTKNFGATVSSGGSDQPTRLTIAQLNTVGPTGPAGFATNTGATGLRGATGPAGAQGIPGTAVNTGATGPAGSASINYSTFNVSSMTAFSGRFNILNVSTLGGFSPITFIDAVNFVSTTTFVTPVAGTTVSTQLIQTSSIATNAMVALDTFKILDVPAAAPALANVLGYDPTTGVVQYQAAGGGGGEVPLRGTLVYIGCNAGSTIQGDRAIAIGMDAGLSNQGIRAVAIGNEAGRRDQGSRAVAVGYYAANWSQGANAIAIGNAGTNEQGTESIAIGYGAGDAYQGSNSVAIGRSAGLSDQNDFSVALGAYAGNLTQSNYAIAIGYEAGSNTQADYTVAIGSQSGSYLQASGAVAVGTSAGLNNQGVNAVAIGTESAQESQGDRAVAIGNSAGDSNQGPKSIAIGYKAGRNSQSSFSIAIGNSAGEESQGPYAIAIGYNAGFSNQAANSIVLNASASTLNVSSSGFFVDPVRNTGIPSTGGLLYVNELTKEVSYNTTLLSPRFNFGYPFTPNTTYAEDWNSIACSETGKYVIALYSTQFGNNGFALSSDFGKTFSISIAGSIPYDHDVAMSGSGQFILGFGSLPDYFYTSADFGQNWSAFNFTGYWYTGDISANGQYQVVGGTSNAIKISTDFGGSWTSIPSGNIETVKDIQISDNGQIVAALFENEGYDISFDGGSTWNGLITFDAYPISLAMNGAGTRFTVGTANNTIYTSVDGVNFSIQTSLANIPEFITMNRGTGQFQLAQIATGGGAGNYYYSLDFGTTWTVQTNSQRWKQFALSYDGTFGVGAVSGGGGGGTNYVWNMFPYLLGVNNRDPNYTFDVTGNTNTSLSTIANTANFSSTITRGLVVDGAIKTFVVDHPSDTNRYLVHGCLEGPEAGVYYRGKDHIQPSTSSTTVELPHYVKSLATDFTVQVTPIYNGVLRQLNVSEVSNGHFQVFGEAGPFFWTVYGTRDTIHVEPLKTAVTVAGDGPYKWIV